MAPRCVSALRSRARWTGAAACLGAASSVWFSPMDVHADPAGPVVAIVVTRQAGAESCPSAVDLVGAVQRLVPRATIVAGTAVAAGMVVHVELDRSAEGLRAQMHPFGRLPGARGGWWRELRDVGPRCQSLGDAVAVTLAMLIDADGSSGAQPEPPSHWSNREPERSVFAPLQRGDARLAPSYASLGGPPPSSAERSARGRDAAGTASPDGMDPSVSGTSTVESSVVTQSASAEAAEQLQPVDEAPPALRATRESAPGPLQAKESAPGAPARAASAAERSRWSLEVGAGVATGILAGAVPAVTGGVEWEISDPLSIAVGASYLVPDQAPTLGGRTRLALANGWARICASTFRHRDRLGVKLCVSPMAGVLRGEGVGYQEARTAHDVWLGIGAGPLVQGWLGGRVGWWGQAIAETPLVLQGFSVQMANGSVSVFQTPRVGWELLMGLRVAL